MINFKKLDDLNVVFVPGGISEESHKILSAILLKRKNAHSSLRKKRKKAKI